MSEFATGYHALGSLSEDDNDGQSFDSDVLIHVVPENGKARWNHIENLDDFFSRVYQYHQRHGFLCMCLEDILQLIQFVFVVLFSTFLIECVNYDVLFANVHQNTSHKVTIPECVKTFDQCVHGFGFVIVICLIIASAFWLIRFIKVVYNIFKYLEIRLFYLIALRISSADLPNLTWHEVQKRLLEVQKEQQMCIHKRELTQLDIYHRILRFKNYMIAMVNKSLMVLTFRMPFVGGECAFLSTGLKYNLEFILFWGPWSPFENNWHLRDDYKNSHKRKELAEQLSRHILWLGIANLIFSPVIFLWQILYSFFRYAELVKREPAALGARRWSNYSRHYVRHFNELDHEFNARLNRAYKPASMYMNIFTTPLLVILSKNIAFFSGSVLAVLLLLTVIDEDVLSVEHVLSTMTVAGLIVHGCRVLIPDEHSVYCPETMMMKTLSHIHYMPDKWKGNAHTYSVRNEFAQLFQYKVVYLIEEMLSPLITPLMLCFSIRHKSLDIVDFFRNFTVDVVGVGDVCSFAEMDIRKHGNPQWVREEDTEANQYQQAEDGKTELSLMHFHLTNPEWKPPENCSLFIHNIKEQAQRDLPSMSTWQPENPLASINSTSSVSLMPALGYPSLMCSLAGQSTVMPSVPFSLTPPSSNTRLGHSVRGAVSHCEGPLSLTAAIPQGSDTLQSSTMTLPSLQRVNVDEGTLELMSLDMSFSALYMHELRHRKSLGVSKDSPDEGRFLWQRQDSNMPGIQERPLEEEDKLRETTTDKPL